MKALILAVGVCGFLLVAAGAIGAHMVPIEDGRRWDGAVLYGFVHTLAALAAALAPISGPWRFAAGWSFIAGVVLFSGIQIVRLLAPGSLDPIGALIPVGGVAFMLGWLLLGASALLGRRTG